MTNSISVGVFDKTIQPSKCREELYGEICIVMWDFRRTSTFYGFFSGLLGVKIFYEIGALFGRWIKICIALSLSVMTMHVGIKRYILALIIAVSSRTNKMIKENRQIYFPLPCKN